jgi:hypothetical protein
MSSDTPVEQHPVSADDRLSPAHVEAAFSEQELWYWNQPARFKVVELGVVIITSGAVVAGDPLFGSMAALKRRIPPGMYPVSLALVRLSSGDERIAFARMLLSTAPVVTWETGWHEAVPQPVVGDGQHRVVLREYAFYFSDAGAGCFADAASVPAIRNFEFDARLSLVMDGFEDNSHNTWSWFSFKPDPSRQENVVCYQSEPGGRHSHFGLDAQGNVAVIITDFRMF